MTLSEENRQASEAFEQRRLSKQILVEVALGPGLLVPRLDELPVLQIDAILDTLIPKWFVNR
jgi:hypothetical protein